MEVKRSEDSASELAIMTHKRDRKNGYKKNSNSMRSHQEISTPTEPGVNLYLSQHKED